MGQIAQQLLSAVIALIRGQQNNQYTEERWVLGDGGCSGNCKKCLEFAQMGWCPIGTFNHPPEHPHCGCHIDYR